MPYIDATNAPIITDKNQVMPRNCDYMVFFYAQT